MENIPFFIDIFTNNQFKTFTLTLGMPIKEVFSEKNCFKNFAHPLSEGENIKK